MCLLALYLPQRTLMPHYMDGELADVGDVVIGTSYNTGDKAIRAGIILDITSDGDTCNAVVGWGASVSRLGPSAYLTGWNRADYTEIKALKKIAGRDGLVSGVDVDVIPGADSAPDADTDAPPANPDE